MWILCLADNSHEIPSPFFLMNHALPHPHPAKQNNNNKKKKQKKNRKKNNKKTKKNKQISVWYTVIVTSAVHVIVYKLSLKA